MSTSNCIPDGVDPVLFALFQRIRAAYERFIIEYPGNVYPDDWSAFAQVIRSEDDIAVAL